MEQMSLKMNVSLKDSFPALNIFLWNLQSFNTYAHGTHGCVFSSRAGVKYIVVFANINANPVNSFVVILHETLKKYIPDMSLQITHLNNSCIPNGSVSYRQTSDISHTLVGNKTVDHSYVVEASPIGAAPTTSSFST